MRTYCSFIVRSPALEEGDHEFIPPLLDFEKPQVAQKYIKNLKSTFVLSKLQCPLLLTGSDLAGNGPLGAEYQGLYYLY